MTRCEYRCCSTLLPLGSRPQRRFCNAAHRAAEFRARRADALELLLLGSRLRREGCTDRALLEDIDRRLHDLMVQSR